MSDKEKRYPISEVFTSPQGEGVWAGTLMTFVRMAGCSVGKPVKDQVRPMLHTLDGEETGNLAWQCKSWDNRPFWCDTDFNTREVLTVSQILERVPEGVKHVCISGGEPLMHNLIPLIEAVNVKDIRVHIETSGTVIPSERTEQKFKDYNVWITVSPKIGVRMLMLRKADEIKLLVDENFDLKGAKTLMFGSGGLIFLQPINGEKDVDMENVKRCLEIQKQMPEWRISLQLHKILSVR